MSHLEPQTPETPRTPEAAAPDPESLRQVVLEHPTDPNFSGSLTFRIPSVYDQARIGARRAQLSGPSGYDLLHAYDRFRLTVLATLEQVIHTAPAGFYVTDPNGLPYLSFEKLSEFDEEVLTQLYKAFQSYRNAARDAYVSAQLVGGDQ